jgi:hypothetical protein
MDDFRSYSQFVGSPLPTETSDVKKSAFCNSKGHFNTSKGSISEQFKTRPDAIGAPAKHFGNRPDAIGTYFYDFKTRSDAIGTLKKHFKTRPDQIGTGSKHFTDRPDAIGTVSKHFLGVPTRSGRPFTISKLDLMRSGRVQKCFKMDPIRSDRVLNYLRKDPKTPIDYNSFAQVSPTPHPNCERISSMSQSHTQTPAPNPIKPPTRAPKSWRIHVAVPGLLGTAIKERREEFNYKTFSPFAVELVCFDLRIRREHIVTLPFSQEPPEVQNAIDRQIIHHYKPGAPQNWELIQRILRGEPWLPPIGKFVEGEFHFFQDHVRFPSKLAPLIEIRWRELGYENLSCYVTGLIRYDLLLSGPHKYFHGDDKKYADVLAALDEETYTAFYARKRQKILLDYLIEEAAGRQMTPAEIEAEMRRLATLIRDNAVRSQKAYEKRKAEQQRTRQQLWR